VFLININEVLYRKLVECLKGLSAYDVLSFKHAAQGASFSQSRFSLLLVLALILWGGIIEGP
jgi:hypothetical protein